jgi:hypothetical protein
MLYCTLIRWMMVSGNTDAWLHTDPSGDGIGQNGCCAASVADGGLYQAKWVLGCTLIRWLFVFSKIT